MEGSLSTLEKKSKGLILNQLKKGAKATNSKLARCIQEKNS